MFIKQDERTWLSPSPTLCSSPESLIASANSGVSIIPQLLSYNNFKQGECKPNSLFVYKKLVPSKKRYKFLKQLFFE